MDLKSLAAASNMRLTMFSSGFLIYMIIFPVYECVN